MGIAEIESLQLTIYSHIIIYGNVATPELTEMMREEIETMWNEPAANLKFDDVKLNVVFKITSSFQPDIIDIHIYQNLDPRNNYFRIE